MRRASSMGSGLGLIAAGLVFGAVGCFFTSPDDCANKLVNCPSATGASTSSSTSTSTSGTGGTPINCIPSESQDTVADSCGVFVSSSLGMDGNEADRGTKQKPFKSITAALNKANVTRVYACAESFSEPVTISTAIELYGALDCTKSWAYVGATQKTTLTAEADKVPLTLTGDATVEDFALTAADAATDGGSSIAVIADQAKASFTRCAFVAGAGKAGLAGTTPTDPVGPPDSSNLAIKGNDGAVACMAPAMQFGGAAKENALCPLASGGPLGGSGGQGAAVAGGDASGGTPLSAGKGLGGKGEVSVGWDCSAGGTNGGAGSGANGAAGTDGDGATGTSSLGTLSSSGYNGTSGQPGSVAPPGQGGGGGGGAKGKPVPACAGASGGGGGAGGCGGKGGLGGSAGGASIALVSLGAMLSFEKVTIKASIGGDGGNGGDGQGGGVGGNGGNGGNGDSTAPATLAACNGGKGGQGGTGGKGGGGRGGHAIGIAYTGATMPLTKGATFTKGTPGKGGLGAADMMHDGDSGVQADVQTFK